MKKLILILILIILAGCMPKEEFCGTSSLDFCETNNDCVTAGCSSQVCQSKDKEQLFTTCEYKECYNYKDYNLECKCVENQCQWG